MELKDFRIIDSHVHIYPSKIADKASLAIGEFYNIEMDYHGSIEELLKENEKTPIVKYLVHSVATTPHQVHRINEFILSEITKHKEFIGFMTLHPDQTYEEMKEEVDFCIENGFKGVKLHPDFQRFAADGEEAEKIYKAVDGRIPILFHAGDKRYNFSSPKMLANVAKRHPNLNIICAHFGGYSEWDKVDEYLGLSNVYFDTSSALEYIGPKKAKEFIEKFGVEKFFFGTDYPMWDATSELERFMKIDLNDEERQKILAENLEKLLGI